MGGSGDESGDGLAVDASGNAYITGLTNSANFPTKNSFQAALGGASDAFVAKLNAAGSALVYSTYVGGSDDDSGAGIAVDSSGNAYVGGSTRSTNFPTASPLQANCKSCANGQGNAFVAKLSAAGSTLIYSTYLGGSGNGTDGDFGNGIAVDASNNAYVTGFTSSPDFPLASPIQATLLPQTCTFDYYGYTYTIPCSNTAFVTRLNPSGSALLYSTYLGASGGNLEYGRGIAVDGAGNAYVTGRATSNFLLTPGAIQLVSGGGDDTFVAKISPNDAPGFSLSSFSLSFQDEGIGGTTLSQQIFLANTGSLTLNIASIVPSGDFAATDTCGSSLAGGASCTINVTFTPTAAGARTGTITITDSMASSPQKVTLTGNGVTGLAATVSPTSLSFGNQTQGTTSAAQSVTLTNTGSATLTITGFSFAGTNPSDFTLSSTGCKQSQSLAVGASCAFSIAFAPQAVGNRSATLQITDNSSQSPRSVTLTGVGIAPPTVTLSAISLSFAAQVVGGTSPGQSVTLATSGSGTLAIVSISTTTSDFGASNNCGNSVAGGATCTITVTFTPTAAGGRAGTLVIASNAANGTQMVSLSGPGTDFSISPAAGSPNSATVTAGQSATYTVSASGASGFSGTVSFSCSDPAFQSSCSISPNSVMVNGTTAQNATVTVTTTARSALPPRWRPPILPPNLRVTLPWLLLLLSLVILTRALRRRSRRRRAWVGVAAMLIAAALFFGCGGGAPPPQNGTPAGTYTITVIATSAGATRTTMLSLTVR
ncbi:MAG: choice-of-anchor D domain-containing protein [Candidatus Acidiferrum sp.]